MSSEENRDFRSGLVRQILFFLMLCGLFLVLDFRGITVRIIEIFELRGGLIPLGFYLFTWVGLIFSLLILYTNKSRVVRFASYFLSFISLAAFSGFRIINGEGYGYNDAVLTVNEFRFAREALYEYTGIVVFGIAVSFFLLFFVGYFCKKKLPVMGKKYLVIVVFFTFCMGLIINRHSDLVIENFPVPFNVPALTCYAAMNKLYAGQRSEPCFMAKGEGAAQHIILIMDESIRGDHLSINNEAYDTTPYLYRLGNRIVNLGIASSAGNQSSTSNIIIQSGITLDQIPDVNHQALRKPSIFQYAGNCGRKTYFFHAQGGGLSNYMTKEDLLHIDEFVSIDAEYPEAARWEYDSLTADLVKSVLQTDERTFVFVLKNGAHFPYEHMYPKSQRVFKPDADSRMGGLFAKIDWEKRLNSYHNAIRWSVDRFFEKFVPLLEKNSCLLVYVSDHGQSMGYKLRGAIVTHNTVNNPPMDQANTPLFLLLSESVRAGMEPGKILALRKNRNRVSHFQVFPSLLYFMGYAKEDISREYGATIFDPVPDIRYFISGDLFGRSTCNKNLFTLKEPTLEGSERETAR
jgi:glucan phosphoethanolaminetransferase (alkaline phosphatase superfamily)